MLIGKIEQTYCYIKLPDNSAEENDLILSTIFNTIKALDKDKKDTRNFSVMDQIHKLEELSQKKTLNISHLFDLDWYNLTSQEFRHNNIHFLISPNSLKFQKGKLTTSKLTVKDLPLDALWCLKNVLATWHEISPSLFPDLEVFIDRFSISFEHKEIENYRMSIQKAIEESGFDRAIDKLSQPISGATDVKDPRLSTTLQTKRFLLWLKNDDGLLDQLFTTPPIIQKVGKVGFLNWDNYNYKKFGDPYILESIIDILQEKLISVVDSWVKLWIEIGCDSKVSQRFADLFKGKITIAPYLSEISSLSNDWAILTSVSGDMKTLKQFCDKFHLDYNNILRASLTKISVNGSEITSRNFAPRILPVHDFENLRITALDLSEIKIVGNLTKSDLDDFKTLTKIYFIGNIIDYSSLELHTLEHLEYVSLQNCGLDTVPNQLFKNCNRLQSVDLSDNFLRELPRSLLELDQIKEIKTDNNFKLNLSEYRSQFSSIEFLSQQ